MKAIAFDLGNTLLSSQVPLNWQVFYKEAFTHMIKKTNLQINLTVINKGEKILSKYNTRLNPREYEVDSNTIFTEILREWGLNEDKMLIKEAVNSFSSFFQGKSTPYPDTIPVLEEIKRRGFKVGVLTNVAYGLGRDFSEPDLVLIKEYIDVLLTSTEVGFRKPNARGYQELAKRLGTDLAGCMFVGDEEVDIVGANKVGMISVLIDRSEHNRVFGQAYTVKDLTGILKLI
jgi:putative hydrolase of the HAD superfamily